MNSPESEQTDTSAHNLIVKSLHGDRDAFRLLMESHLQYTYALAFRLLHDEDKAKDVVQESFIKVWNNLHNSRHEIKFTTWLYKIVVNRCYDTMKMESRQKTIFGLRAGFLRPEDVADGRDVHGELENIDLRKHILSAAKRLPPKERLVFHLRDVQDFSIGEIAEYTGISTGAVKTNLYYARKRIRMDLMRLQERERQ